MRVLGKERGAALIELGISLPLLLLIVFGITEFGRAIFEYNTLAKATRDATRFLSTRAPGDTAAIADAECLAVHGNPTCSGPALVSGLTTAMVSVCDALSCPATHQAQGTAPVINLVTVTIGGANNPFPFDSVIPFVLADINFGAISVTMKQVL
ncbi:MAG: TadE/TadG family type IV pilus assembly protein [Burkholderiales bacterium]